MGKKKSDSKLNKCVYLWVAVIYIAVNILMLSMLVIRIVTVFTDRSAIDVTEFPPDCSSEKLVSCSRLVLDQATCRNIEDLKIKDYTLIYNNTLKNESIASILSYCAQSMGINSLIYPNDWPDSVMESGFIHQAVETLFLGLVDDVYINWDPFMGGSNFTLVQIQSQPHLNIPDFQRENEENI